MNQHGGFAAGRKVLMVWYSSCNTVTSVKEKSLSQNPNFEYGKTKQTFEASGTDLLNIQETLTASL
jgi:hypothetical protein